MSTDAQPTAPSERIYTLDVIRGFALLGIFIMNMPSFNQSFYIYMAPDKPWPEWWNAATETATEVLFSGKFNSMFSMLFAIGFIIQIERLEARDPAKALTTYLRRIFWLLLFGITHLLVFWNGDVLHIYAIFGLVLLGLRRAPEKLLWTIFGLCMLLPVGIGVYRLLTFDPAQGERLRELMQAWIASNNAAYGHGSFFAAMREHARELLFTYSEPSNLRGMLIFSTSILATMILGLISARRRLFQNAASHLPLIRRLQWWSLGLGLACGGVHGYWQAVTTDFITPTPFRMIAIICYLCGRVLIMVFYVATIARAAHSPRWSPKLSPMATAGRMPLTNYLMQTFIATTLFYGWGFGLWGKVGPALDLALAIGIFFLVQVPLSKWWLGRFELGPMEWLWRKLTYGHASMRRSAPVTAPA